MQTKTRQGGLTSCGFISPPLIFNLPPPSLSGTTNQQETPAASSMDESQCESQFSESVLGSDAGGADGEGSAPAGVARVMQAAWGLSTESLDGVLFRAPSTSALGSLLGPTLARQGLQQLNSQEGRPVPGVRDTLPRNIAGWDRVPRGVSSLVPAASSSGDLVAFMCQFAFFVVPADDPRVPLLRVRAALDTELSAHGSRGIHGWQRLVEYGVDGDSVKYATGGLQAVVALLACLQAVLVAVLIATLPLTYSINVVEWCTRPSTDVVPLAHSSIDAVVLTLRVMCVALAIAMVSFAIVVTRSMFGVRATEFVWRYTRLTWLTHKLHAFACVLAAGVALVEHEWFLLSVAVGALGALPLFDLAAMLTSRRWVSRLYTTALILLVAAEFVRFELNIYACDSDGNAQANEGPLGSVVLKQLGTVARLLFVFGTASALFRKVRLPSEPLAMGPWCPFLTAIPIIQSQSVHPTNSGGEGDDGQNNDPGNSHDEPLFDVFYGPHETRVVAVGSPEHSVVRGQMRVAGSWRVAADRSSTIDAVFTTVTYLYMVLTVVSTAFDIVVMVHDANHDRRCFEVSQGASWLARVAFAAWISVNLSVMAIAIPLGIFMTAKALRSKWMTAVQYIFWLAMRHPAFVCTTFISTVTSAATRFNPGRPPTYFAVGLCLPLYDFLLITVPPRSALWRASRAAILVSWVTFSFEFVLISVRAPLMCSVRVDDATITDIVLYVIFSAASSIWQFQCTVMFLNKIKDPSTPFIPFTIEPKRAYENLWFDVAKARRAR